MTPDQATTALEKIKAQWRKASPWGCKVFSKGDACECVLCLADNLRGLVDGLELAKAVRSAFSKDGEFNHRSSNYGTVELREMADAILGG